MIGSVLHQASERLRLPVAEYRSSTIGELFGCLAAGMIIGAATALLVAPKAGADLRKELRRRFRLVRDRNEEFAEQARAEGGVPGPDPVKHIAP